MNDTDTYFITWTTYGTWLPGDARGWRHRHQGHQPPEPALEQWSRQQMKGEVVLLTDQDRQTVEAACREHCQIRGWELLTVRAQTNHVHVVVTADETPKKVRDQLKANATRRLREQVAPLVVEKTWTKGGDCEILYTEKEIEAVVTYVSEAQDRKYRDHL